MIRDPVLSAAVIKARGEGRSVEQICEQFGASETWVRKKLRESGVNFVNPHRAAVDGSGSRETTRDQMDRWCKKHLADLHAERARSIGARQ